MLPGWLDGFFSCVVLWLLLFVTGFAPWVAGYKRYKGRHKTKRRR